MRASILCSWPVSSWLSGEFFSTGQPEVPRRYYPQLLESVADSVLKSVRPAPTEMTGLSAMHPLRKFVTNPKEIDNFIDLDDTVVWGSLSLMAGGNDAVVQDFAGRLKQRRRCTSASIFDQAVTVQIDPGNQGNLDDSRYLIPRCCESRSAGHWRPSLSGKFRQRCNATSSSRRSPCIQRTSR